MFAWAGRTEDSGRTSRYRDHPAELSRRQISCSLTIPPDMASLAATSSSLDTSTEEVEESTVTSGLLTIISTGETQTVRLRLDT